MSLIDQIKASALVPKRYEGAIPLTVPAIRADGRHFAGGNRVFQEILKVFMTGYREKVRRIEKNITDFSDAIFTFEDDIIIQLESPFLTGIMGVVRTQDKTYVAVDAVAVQSGIDKSKTKEFKVSGTEIVKYIRNGETQREEVSNVVLIPYDGRVMSFTPTQLKAITCNVYRAKRSDIILGQGFRQDQMVKDGKVLQFPWRHYSADVLVPLFEGGVNHEGKPFGGLFAYNKREHDYNTNSPFLPADAPSGNNVEMRALYANTLDWFGLYGEAGLGDGNCYLIGIGDKSAAGATQHIQPPLEELAGKGN